MLQKTLHEALQGFVSLLYPNSCSGCYEELVGNEKHICTSCLEAFPKTHFHEYGMNEVAKKLYGRMLFQRASALFYFNKNSVLQEVLHAVKYRQDKELGIHLGRLMARQLVKTKWLDQLDALIPIPLSEKKLKQRGYNQSDLLAQGIQEELGLVIWNRAVERSRHTETQTHKSIQQRHENVQDAFQVTKESTLANKHVLLIDDVLTTGATIISCAREILRAPGAEVSVLTLAYAID
jgi:ComF family protein